MLNSLKPCFRIPYDPVISTRINLKYSQGWAYGVRTVGKTRRLSQSVPTPNHSQWQILSGKDKQRPSAQWYPTKTLSQLPEICKGSLSWEPHLRVYFWSIMPWFHVITCWTQVNFWHSQGTQIQPAAFCCTQGLWHTPQVTESHSNKRPWDTLPLKSMFWPKLYLCLPWLFSGAKLEPAPGGSEKQMKYWLRQHL